MLKGFLTLYSFAFPRIILSAWYDQDRHVLAYLKWFWSSKSYVEKSRHSHVPTSSIAFLVFGMLLQIIFALYLIYQDIFGDLTAGISFGLAVLVIMPVLWAHLIIIPHSIMRLIASVLQPKKLGKALLCAILEKQVKELRKQHQIKVVAVVGSVGKTSTKLAIASLLGQSIRVRYQVGNYNDRLTVPLIFFDQPLPNLFNFVAWLKILSNNRKQIKGTYPFDVVVAELGTDGPNQLQKFAYLHPELAVVTAVEAEHMEFFKTLDAVAKEELAVCEYAQSVLVNIDNVDAKYLEQKKFKSYGAHTGAQYQLLSRHPKGIDGAKIKLQLEKDVIESEVSLLGKQGSMIALAAAATGHMLGLSKKEMSKGLPQIKAFAGRMRVLKGYSDATIIDDSYNASPVAVTAGIDVLCAIPAKKRIAILGNMNELGAVSPEAHRDVGLHCDPKRIDLVVTIGPDANAYLAPAAAENGCATQTFDSPYAAGQFVKEQLSDDTLVLVEGSQNRVFAEEATKQILADPNDAQLLVRQSNYWMNIKRSQFVDAD